MGGGGRAMGVGGVGPRARERNGDESVIGAGLATRVRWRPRRVARRRRSARVRPEQSMADEAKAKGNKALQAKQFDEAIGHYTTAIGPKWGAPGEPNVCCAVL